MRTRHNDLGISEEFDAEQELTERHQEQRNRFEPPEPKQIITFSRLDSFKTCRKKHQFAYEWKVRPVEDAKALRMGRAHHAAIECLGDGKGLETACNAIYEDYRAATSTEFVDAAILYEQETVLRIACGYDWRWSNDQLVYLETEKSFRIPLRNPRTGHSTPIFDLAGKIDGIVRLPDGRLAVKESKLFGEDIGSDASLWKRMRMDHQVSMYVLAAREIGYNVDTVLFDVARKPTIKPEQVELLDDNFLKVVVDAHGQRVSNKDGQFRQSGDKAKGYTLQTRPQNVDEWGLKLTADIIERPEWYFARVEIPRLEQDLEEFQYEIWDLQLTLRDAQLQERWYRTVNRNTCQFCSVFDLCSQRWKQGDTLPESFQVLDDPHPEL